MPTRTRAWSARGRRPVQWTGVVVAVAVAAWAAALVFAFSSALAEVNPWLAPLTNAVAAGGLAPAVWSWRGRPVLRFFAAGLGAGVAAGWLALVVSLS